MCIGDCIGSCLATCGCQAVQGCCPSMKNAGKLPYIVVMFLSTMLAIILRFLGGPVLIHLYVTDIGVCTSDKCVGFGAVYRISFALFVWFACHGLLLLSSSCHSIDRGHWCLKLSVYLSLLVLSWMIPNDFYEVYVHIARAISGIFLFLQILILIDFAISWHEDWLKKDWKIPMLACALAMYAASLILIIFMFRWFGGSGCNVENFFLAFTIICTFIFTAVSLREREVDKDAAGDDNQRGDPRGGILTPSIVSLYIHYVCYSALSSDPGTCNSLNDTSTVQLVISLIIAALSICYAAWNLATSNSLFGDPKDEDEVRAEKEVALNREAASGALGTAKMPGGDAAAKNPAADSGSGGAAPAAAGDAVVVPVKESAPAEPKAADPPAKPKKSVDVESAAQADEPDAEEQAKYDTAHSMRNARFHAVMAAGSMYMAMILTNWSSYQVGVEAQLATSDFGAESMWIKIVSQWVTCIVYVWWLVAPIVCANRDFS